MRKVYSLIVIWLCLLQNLPAQGLQNFSFTQYTSNTGLISNQINTVVQDTEGYIWIGTTDGLQRFDGTRYKTFRHKENDPSTIPSNPVLQLLFDKNKNLWLLTNEGRIGIFNTRNFTFKEASVKVKNDTAIRYVLKKINTDESGNIFYSLGTNELLTWNPEQNEFSKEHNFFIDPSGGGIASFTHQQGTKKYWMTIEKGHFAVFNAATGNLNYPGHNPDKEKIVDESIHFKNPFNLFIDKKNRFWFQSWGDGYPTIYCYDLNSNKFILNKYDFQSELRSYYETESFFEDQDATIWIRGLSVFASYSEKKKKFEMVYNGHITDRSISYEKIHCLFQDREKNIWVGTSNNGLFRFNPSEQYFTNIAHIHKVTKRPGNGSVMSFTSTKWGTILVGTWGDGIYEYDKNLNLLPVNIKGLTGTPSVWSMCLSADSNTIWMSAQPGIYAVDQATRTAKFYNPPLLENRTVRQVAEDKSGNLWLGMQKFGVFKWNAAKGKKIFNEGITRFSPIPLVHVNQIITDQKGLVWVATSSNGVYVIDPLIDKIVHHFHQYGTNENKLPEEGVSAVLEYDDSTLVITTATRVLIYNRYAKTTISLGTPEMISGYIAGVKKDKNGYLWISTTTGIYRTNIKTRVFVLFNRVDGIENDNFTLSASLALPDGRLLFGSSTQFISFNPSSIRVSNAYPDITITDFKISNKSMSVDSLLRLKKIVLGPASNNVTIEFSSLTYSSAYLIKYKLEGLDKEWKNSDKNYQAVYSYLPAGTYTFLVKSVDAEGQEGQRTTSLTIRVKPHFWNTWWFYSLCAVLLGLVIFFIDRERMKRKEGIRKMRNDIAANLHTEVSTALNNINLLSEMARIKAEQDPKKSKEYIEQIHFKSHNMIIAMDDMLWTLDTANDDMEKTVDRMREYIDALKNRYGININLFVDERVQLLQLKMKLRYDAFLMFKEGLKNLITTGATNLKVQIGYEKDKLRFSMQFDNEGCDMQLLNNLLHRQDLEKRLEQMNAKVNIEVHKTSSVIFLQIPIN